MNWWTSEVALQVFNTLAILLQLVTLVYVRHTHIDLHSIADGELRNKKNSEA